MAQEIASCCSMKVVLLAFAGIEKRRKKTLPKKNVVM